MRIKLKYLLGIFLLSFSTLLFELSLTRVFSVTLWYHFGFLIISTALLGFGVSGVLLSLWKKFREEYELDKTLGWLSIFLSLSIIGSFWLLQKIPFDPFSLYTDNMQLLYMPLTYILVAIPFFFAGLALSLLFTRHPSHISRLYAFDLTGAALGCLAIVFTISYFGGGGSVLFAAVFASLGAILFFGVSYKIQTAFAGILMIISFLFSLNSDKAIPLRITSNKRMSADTTKPAISKWNTFSKIDLFVDSSETIPGKLSPVFIIDYGTAATGLDFDLRPDVRTVLQEHPGDSLYQSCLAYLNKTKPTVLVIGSGCGTQVLDALHHGVNKVIAVEINPIINEIASQTMNDMWGNLFHQPEVQLVTDEGRNYVRSSKEKFHAIVSVHTISNAAVASGALSLAENYVLTKEAFEDYYDHLTDSGTVYFTRPEFQIPRLFATGREVLEERGVEDVAKHFFAYTYPAPAQWSGRKSFYAIFIMSKPAFTPEQIESMKSFISKIKDNDTDPVLLYDPYQKYHNIYDSVLQSKDVTSLYANYPYEISPATDNDPFFNHHTRWSSINMQSFEDIFTQNKFGRLALEDKPVAEVSLIILLAQVILISAVFILLPLWRFSSKGLKTKNVFSYLLYFSGLGCGFIMIEIVLIQQFSLLLGEPVYTFAIVLGALLLFTGIGAYLSGRFSEHAQRAVQNSVLILSALLLLASFFLPSLLHTAIALSLAGRITLAILLIMPVGIALGMPFPSGIRLISTEAPQLIPWAWGVNGFSTVIGSVIALMLSMMIGFQAVLWIAIVIYLLCMLLLKKLHGLQK
jgi:MFS family permease